MQLCHDQWNLVGSVTGEPLFGLIQKIILFSILRHTVYLSYTYFVLFVRDLKIHFPVTVCLYSGIQWDTCLLRLCYTENDAASVAFGNLWDF